jgi:hypothetical protein
LFSFSLCLSDFSFLLFAFSFPFIGLYPLAFPKNPCPSVQSVVRSLRFFAFPISAFAVLISVCQLFSISAFADCVVSEFDFADRGFEAIMCL